MLLVVETTGDAEIINSQAVQHTLATHKLQLTTSPIQFSDRFYYYFSIDPRENMNKAINDLLQISGISAAYAKPEGAAGYINHNT